MKSAERNGKVAIDRVIAVVAVFALAFSCQMFVPDTALAAGKSSGAAAKASAASASTGSASKDKGQQDDSGSDDSGTDESAASGTSSAGSASSGASSSKQSSTVATPDESKDKDKPVKKEDEAAKRRAEAEALYAQISAIEASLEEVKKEYAEAENAFNEATTALEETQRQLEAEEAGIEGLRTELASFVVDMYKQGGVAPYLDVLLRSTSYTEFLTSWYMTNEVSLYGRGVVREKTAVIDELKTQVQTLQEKADEAEKTMVKTDLKRRQVNLTRMALVTQAVSLNADAAQLLGDEESLTNYQEELEALRRDLDAAIADGVIAENELVGNGIFTHPCPTATYSSGFGYRSFDNAFHQGLDMAIAEGTPYFAADNGVVIAATNGGGYNGGAGNWVVIDHGNGIVTKYMHSSAVYVSVGQQVTRGQNIGAVGNTGASFGAHLHFQVEVDGVAVNPLNYI